MVEGVERIHFEGESQPLVKLEALADAHVEVVDARPVEDAPLGVAEVAQILLRKQGGIEGRLAVTPVSIDLERPGEVLRGVQQVVVNPVAEGAAQRVIGIVIQCHRESTCKARGSG